MSRNVVWFSCGAASAITLFLCKDLENLHAVYTDTGSEHPDSKRFLKDIEKWLKIKVTQLKNDKYNNHFEVLEDVNFINSAYGAPCTGMLKKNVRFGFQRPGDVQYFGYTYDKRDIDRANRFKERHSDLDVRFPLIENKITKSECLKYLSHAEIEIPAMYKLNYPNNNCVGCVKGGMGCWSKIRVDFQTCLIAWQN